VFFAVNPLQLSGSPALFDLLQKTDLGEIPVTLNGLAGNPQQRRDLFILGTTLR
jgi:hypothetical protein